MTSFLSLEPGWGDLKTLKARTDRQDSEYSVLSNHTHQAIFKVKFHLIMSGIPIDTKLGNVSRDDGLPRHQVHNSDDPLPGSHPDQQPAEVQQLSDRNLSHEEAALRGQGHNAFNSERPLDVHPTRAGGVARAGEDDLPMGKANILDKAIGKMEKVIGKATHNADMHEAGELREAGGKKAVIGEARAPHD